MAAQPRRAGGIALVATERLASFVWLALLGRQVRVVARGGVTEARSRTFDDGPRAKRLEARASPAPRPVVAVKCDHASVRDIYALCNTRACKFYCVVTLSPVPVLPVLFST